MGFAVSKFLFIPPTVSRYDLSTFPHNQIFIPKRRPIEESTSSKIPCQYVHCEGAEHQQQYCHGNACDQGLQYPEVCLLAQSLRVSLLAIEYPGYGQHKGHPTERGCFETLRQVLQYIQSEMKISYGRIVLYGRSLGTGVVTQVAAEQCRAGTPPCGIITQSPFKSIKTLVADVVGTSFFMMQELFDSKEAIQDVTCPLLVIHGVCDEQIPYKHGEELFHKAKSVRKRLHQCPQATHNDFPNYVEEVLVPVGKFLEGFCTVQVSTQMLEAAACNPILEGMVYGLTRLVLPEEMFQPPPGIKNTEATIQQTCTTSGKEDLDGVLRYPCLSHTLGDIAQARIKYKQNNNSYNTTTSTTTITPQPILIPLPDEANAKIYENILMSPRTSNSAVEQFVEFADHSAIQDLRKAQSAEAAAVYVNSKYL